MVLPSIVVTVCVVLPSAVYSSQAGPSGNFVFVFLKLNYDDDGYDDEDQKEKLSIESIQLN